MQFQLFTDYAIRILIHLHTHEDLQTATEIAESVGVSYPVFVKVANQMKKKGLLCSVQGRYGGYRLGRSAHKISLYDVVSAIEGGLAINRCLRDDRYCSRHATEHCPVHDNFQNLQNMLIEHLSGQYISDF